MASPQPGLDDSDALRVLHRVFGYDSFRGQQSGRVARGGRRSPGRRAAPDRAEPTRGAQVRLVALSMTLGLAEEVVVTDPAAVRALIAEARVSTGTRWPSCATWCVASIRRCSPIGGSPSSAWPPTGDDNRHVLAVLTYLEGR
jgi:hypothetical protein